MALYQRSYQIDYFCGWRYLLSEKFRNHVRSKWMRNPLQKALCMIGGFTSIALTTAAAILLTMAVWNLINS